MIRRIAFLSALIFVSYSSAVAGPIGPHMPRRARTSLGVELAADQREMKKVNVTQDVRRFEPIYGLLRLDYGISDKVQVTLRAGSTNTEYLDLVDVNAVRTKFDDGGAFAFGAQGTATIYEAPAWNLVLMGNILAHTSAGGLWPGLGQTEFSYKEWNFGLQAQGRFQRLVPYIGIKYSGARVDYELPIGTSDDESEDHAGIYGGTGISLNPHWTGYIEGRFIDETSFGAGIRYTY